MSDNATKIPQAPTQKSRRRISSVWLIPILAIALGLWLVWNHYQSQGPLVTITFETTEGVAAGKTKVQCRSVSVGTVTSVALSGDLQGVVTTIRMDKDTQRLLREDTQFWIVRPRVGGAGISGLGTIVSGNYIELDPGLSEKAASRFTGLERPPVTPLSVPGLRISLLSDEASSLGAGSPISYKGITVGRIEDRAFQTDSNQVQFDAFIENDYRDFVVTNTRFWNVTGVDLNVSADGFRLRTGSLGSLVAGGVEFGLPEGEQAAQPVNDGTVFRLHEDADGPEEVTINPTLTYMLLFEDSVRGLRPQAPVEFRGIRAGHVSAISFDLYQDEKHRVPVLIQLDPKRIAHHEGHESGGEASIAACVEEGLRATLKTGSLLTGQLFIDLDYQEDAEPADTSKLNGYLTLTKASQSAGSFLNAKSTQELPDDIQNTLTSIQETLAGLDENSVLYRDLFRTLDELRDSLRSIQQLADSVERKPNSLIFGRGKSKPAAPKAKR